MAAPVRTLGFASRREAILSLAMQGLTPSEIAESINTAHPEAAASGRQIGSYLSALRRNGQCVPVPVRLDEELYQQLTTAAKARGSRADHLAGRLMATILRDQLVDAILDDGGDG